MGAAFLYNEPEYGVYTGLNRDCTLSLNRDYMLAQMDFTLLCFEFVWSPY